jgi:hypothetical protein
MLCLILLIGATSFCYAVNPKVQLNGNYVDFKDENGNTVEAQIINSRTMVPLRKIFELMKCEINWDGATKTVVANNGKREITLQIGNSVAKLVDLNTNKEDSITLDSPPVIKDNRTLVPLRFIGESLGKKVAWDSQDKVAIIIDYDDLAKLLEQKALGAYNILSSKGSTLSIEKKYIDEVFSDRNETTKMVSTRVDDSNYKIQFSGTSELVDEIKNEEWDNISFSLNVNTDDYEIITSNYVFSSMFGGKKNEKITVSKNKSNIKGTDTDGLGDTLGNLICVSDNDFTKETYSKIKADFERLFKTFLTNGEKSLKVSDLQFETIDISRVSKTFGTNIIFNIFTLANEKMFHYNNNVNDFFVDFPRVNYSVSVGNNNINIKIILRNDYKECNEFHLVLN